VNLLQSWPACPQCQTLVTPTLRAWTAVRLSTSQTTRVSIFSSDFKTRSHFIFCFTLLFYSCPIGVKFCWTWPLVCSLTRLIQSCLKTALFSTAYSTSHTVHWQAAPPICALHKFVLHCIVLSGEWVQGEWQIDSCCVYMWVDCPVQERVGEKHYHQTWLCQCKGETHENYHCCLT